MKLSSRNLSFLAVLPVLLFVAGACSQQARPQRPAKSVSELETVHFDYDKSDIRSDARRILNGNSEWMKAHPNSKVVLEGHCDKRGSTDYNIALGWRRARSTKNFLVSSGVSSSRMETKSYGKERLLCNGDDENCHSRNRRVEFVNAR